MKHTLTLKETYSETELPDDDIPVGSNTTKRYAIERRDDGTVMVWDGHNGYDFDSVRDVVRAAIRARRGQDQ